MTRSLIVLLLLSLSYGGALSSQTSQLQDAIVSESSVTLLGKSTPLRDISDEQLHRSSKADFKKNKQRPANFPNRRGFSKAVLLEIEHQGPDVLRQSDMSGVDVVTEVEPLINIDGAFNNFGSPHDPSGDVGLDYYVQAINSTVVRIFDKTDGSIVASFQMQNFWTQFGVSSEGDPIILFDDRENRWFFTEFTDPANILIAVSETSDPLGAYFAYNFSTPNFPDYPKFGIWPDHFVATTNEGGPGTLHQYFIDKSALLVGDPSAVMQRVSIQGNGNTEAGFFVSTPVDIDGNEDPADPRPIVMTLDDSSWGSAPQDRLRLFRFDIDYANSNNTVVEQVNIPLSPYDGFPCSAPGFGFACIPQQGGNGLDGIPEVIMNVPKLRRFNDHESLVFSFVTDVTDGDNLSGIRWVELRKNGADQEWEVYQEGTYAPDDGLDRFMSSIAIDANGNIGMAYNVSSPNSFASIRFTGRTANDPLGQMTVTEFEAVAGSNTINSGGRFGDYAQMGVDPVDGSTFWFTSEYANGGNSRTRIVAFQVQLADFDLAATEIVEPSTSSTLTSAETVSVLVTNNGANALTDFIVGYSVDGVFVEEVLFTETIGTGETFLAEFDTPIDMSVVGQYVIEAYIEHPDDAAQFNDETAKVVEQLYDVDAAVVDFSAAEGSCADEVIASVQITNIGFQTITEAEIEVSVNGAFVDNVDYIGSISTDESDEVTFSIPLTLGDNDITVQIISVNGAADLDDTNDITLGAVEKIEGEAYIFTLVTDEYALETNWEVVGDNGTVIAESGNLAGQNEETIVTELCLDPEACYTFTITDTYGDGICCDFGQGSYTLEFDGAEIFEGGEFANESTHQFCGSAVVNAITEVELDAASFKVFPNPNDGYFQLSFVSDQLDAQRTRLSVFDANGRQIQGRLIAKYDDAFVTEVSLVEYPAGIYSVMLTDGLHRVVTSVIKQ